MCESVHRTVLKLWWRSAQQEDWVSWKLSNPDAHTPPLLCTHKPVHIITSINSVIRTATVTKCKHLPWKAILQQRSGVPVVNGMVWPFFRLSSNINESECRGFLFKASQSCCYHEPINPFIATQDKGEGEVPPKRYTPARGEPTTFGQLCLSLKHLSTLATSSSPDLLPSKILWKGLAFCLMIKGKFV